MWGGKKGRGGVKQIKNVPCARRGKKGGFFHLGTYSRISPDIVLSSACRCFIVIAENSTVTGKTG